MLGLAIPAAVLQPPNEERTKIVCFDLYFQHTGIEGIQTSL
jgi:hypothetical protein